MIENNQLEEPTIDVLVVVFKRAVNKIANVIKKHHLIEAIEAIEKLSTQKKVQHQQDQATLEKLDSMLNDF